MPQCKNDSGGGGGGGGDEPDEPVAEYDFICTNGTPKDGKSTAQNTEGCASCNTDWTLTTDACVFPGAATRVGMATKFGQGEGTPRDLAAIGNTLYMVGAGKDRLYTVDTTTGEATVVGTAATFGVGETTPTGLAAIGNNPLYGGCYQ